MIATSIGMGDEETQLDLKTRMRDALAPMLANEQEKTAKNSLPNNNPEKWLTAASLFLSGASVHEVKKTMNLNHHIAKRINGIVKASDDARVFRQERAIQLASTIDEINSIGEKIAASYLDGSPEALEKIKRAETKDLANLAVAQEKLHRTFDNVTGNNVQKIEVRHITTPEEAMSLIDALPEAEIIDVEEDG